MMLETFRADRGAVLPAQGWTPDSPMAKAFERRLSQAEASGYFGMANVLATLGAAGIAMALSLRAAAYARTSPVAKPTPSSLAVWAVIASAVVLVYYAGAKGGFAAAGLGVASCLWWASCWPPRAGAFGPGGRPAAGIGRGACAAARRGSGVGGQAVRRTLHPVPLVLHAGIGTDHRGPPAAGRGCCGFQGRVPPCEEPAVTGGSYEPAQRAARHHRLDGTDGRGAGAPLDVLGVVGRGGKLLGRSSDMPETVPTWHHLRLHAGVLILSLVAVATIGVIAAGAGDRHAGDRAGAHRGAGARGVGCRRRLACAAKHAARPDAAREACALAAAAVTAAHAPTARSN